MKDFTWPSALVFISVIAALAVMYAFADDPATRIKLVGYFDAIVPFIVGAAAGGTIGTVVGFARARQLFRVPN